MCFDPASIATAVSILGTVTGAAGSIVSGVQQNNVAKYNAQVAENNAKAERDRAAYDMNLMDERRRQTIASQRAAGVSSGLDISTGTPVAVMGDTARNYEMDILSRKYSGEAASTAYRNDAQRFLAEGKASQTAGVIGAGSSLLSGFGRIASRPGNSSRYSPLSRSDPWYGRRRAG